MKINFLRVSAIVSLVFFISIAYSEEKKDEDAKDETTKDNVVEVKYSSLEEVEKAGKDAVGFAVNLKLKPVAISHDSVTFTDEKGKYFKVFFQTKKRKLIRKLRRNEYHIVTLLIKSIRYDGIVIYEFINGDLAGGG